MSDLLPLDELYSGDCRDLLKSLPDGCVDLVVSSPPYNLGKEYEARKALANYLEEQRIVLAECALQQQASFCEVDISAQE